MQNKKFAVVGLGATGTVLAAALLDRDPETILVGRNPDLHALLTRDGLIVSGAIEYRCGVENYCSSFAELAGYQPDLIFLCTKTFHLPQIIADLKQIHQPGMKIVAAQNGIDPEMRVASAFGEEDVWRMSLNYGAALHKPGRVRTAFFNKPNHIGCMSQPDRSDAQQVATILSESGLDTEVVDDIQRVVWQKMVMKCTMSAVCAVTDRTFSEALTFKATREIADACIAEVLAVAEAIGYDFGEESARQAVAYLLKAGNHKDSMCQDIANRAPTEIDYLGAKVVEYGRANGVPTPHLMTMTNLVKTIEAGYRKD